MSKIIPMSDETRQKLEEIADKLKGKVLLVKAIERAKESLKNIKNIPF